MDIGQLEENTKVRPAIKWATTQSLDFLTCDEARQEARLAIFYALPLYREDGGRSIEMFIKQKIKWHFADLRDRHRVRARFDIPIASLAKNRRPYLLLEDNTAALDDWELDPRAPDDASARFDNAESEAMCSAFIERLRQDCDERQRRVLDARLEGQTVRSIAQDMGTTRAVVEFASQGVRMLATRAMQEHDILSRMIVPPRISVRRDDKLSVDWIEQEMRERFLAPRVLENEDRTEEAERRIVRRYTWGTMLGCYRSAKKCWYTLMVEGRLNVTSGVVNGKGRTCARIPMIWYQRWVQSHFRRQNGASTSDPALLKSVRGG